MKRKHIIITKIFNFSGSNTHLKTLIKYFGKENIILILEDEEQLLNIKNIEGAKDTEIIINKTLYAHAHLRYRLSTNIKEFFYILRSILAIQLLSLKHGFAGITINAVEPEKHLYFLWMPVSRVTYILHTQPNKKYTSFTSYTCNTMLGKRKRIVTVSNANKKVICEKWDISNKKQAFVHVIYNCIVEDEFMHTRKSDVKDTLKVITLGHVIAYKNPATWLRVAQSITAVRKDVQFTWLGDGPLYNEFNEATRDLKGITFPGPVLHPYTYLRGAAVYYQPTLYETHGISVVEAMYNSLPCVVSNTGGLPESVQDKQTGFLVNPLDADEHVNAILKLIDNARLREEYGLNAYKKYQTTFTYGIFKAKMDAIYY